MNANLLNDAIDFYNSGNSMAKTARKFHSTAATLKRLFLKNNVHIRTQSEQCVIENIRRTKKVNHSYFDPLTQQSAYYLGFLAADGTVRKDKNEIKLCLSSVDIDFLREFKDNLELESDLHTYTTNNGFSCTELRFSSLKIKQDIMKYGVVPNKTKIGLNLGLIPDEFKLAFIKGFFDGDGSFVFNKNSKQIKVSFTSHTKGILESILEFLQIKGYIYEDKRRTQLYSLEFSTLPSLEIMKKFYDLDTPCLLRKKEKYENCLKLRNNYPRDRNSLDKDEKIC